MIRIATFYSHFGAIRFKRACDAKSIPAKLMPVPRSLSSSCGTCVQFDGDCPGVTEEIEQIVACENDEYRTLYRADNA